MSDERDSTTLPRWEQLLRQLEETHQRLERAHADYLEASTESEKALRRIIDSFGDLSEIVRSLVDEPEANKPPSADAAPSEVPTADNSADDDVDDSPPGDVDESDHGQNTLPARLHSRGVSIPDSEVPAPPPETPPTAQTPKAHTPPPRTRPPVEMARPRLVDAPYGTDRRPFSGLHRDRRIVLTNDGFGVAPALNEILSEKGYRVRIDSRRPELSAPADTVIFLGSLRAPSDLDDAMDVIDDAMYTADQMTTRLMQPDSAFVTVVDTSGGFGIEDFEPVTAPFGALPGLIELLDRRHPGATTKLIDLAGAKLDGDRIAQRLAEELIDGGDTSPVALRGDQRRTLEWTDAEGPGRPANWLEDETPPLVYMPGPDAVLSTAVERLAIAHELPVALLMRRNAPRQLVEHYSRLGIDTRSADYDLDRLFSVMDFLDATRRDRGPISAVIAESIPANNPEDLARWEVMRPPLDEFNALLAMTINDPLRLLGVGLGPNTPPVIRSALRYFARAESLRRREKLQVRLAHLADAPAGPTDDLGPREFALTEFLASADPTAAEIRFGS